MVATLICTAAVCVVFYFVARYIDSSYEDFKEYRDTQDKYNDR